MARSDTSTTYSPRTRISIRPEGWFGALLRSESISLLEPRVCRLGRRAVQNMVLLCRNGDGDVAVFDHAVVITLQIKRSWLGLVAIESATGRAGDLDVVGINLAIAQHRYMSADQSDVEG